MASLDSYEIPKHLIEFIENEMQGTYFDNMLKSGMIATLSLEKLRYLNYIYLIKTKKYLNILEKWELKDKFLKTIQFNIDYYDCKEKSSEKYLTTHVISYHNFEYYKETGLRDKNKNTLLNYAIKNSNFELAKSELKYCSYGKPSVTGYTPLMNLLESHERLWNNCHWNDLNNTVKKEIETNIKNLFNKMIKRPLACNLYQKNKFKKTVFDIALNVYDLYYFNKLIEICDLSRFNVINIFNIIKDKIDKYPSFYTGRDFFDYYYYVNTSLDNINLFIENLVKIYENHCVEIKDIKILLIKLVFLKNNYKNNKSLLYFNKSLSSVDIK